MSIHTEFIKLFELSVKEGWRTVPVLAFKDKKNPIYKHAAPKDYDGQLAQMMSELLDGTPRQKAYWERQMNKHNLNLLLDELYVIDCDSPEALRFVQEEVAPQFPSDFEDCPMQQTRKGMHYVFLRPEGCDHYNTSKAVTVNGSKLDLDICTVSSTGTRGNLNVYPSPNKTWVRSIHEYTPKVLSSELYAFLDKIFTGKRGDTANTSSTRRTKFGNKVVMDPEPTGSGNSTASAYAAATNPNQKLTKRQQLYTEFVIRRSMLDGQPTVGRHQVVWQSETMARINTRGSRVLRKDDQGVPKCCRQCLADPQHVADSDNAMMVLRDDGSLFHYCASPSCGQKSKYFGLAEVVLASVGNPPLNLEEVLVSAMPPDWCRLYRRIGQSLGQLRSRDMALEALELGGLSDGRLLRDADSKEVYAFGEHTFRMIHDEVGALYKRWIEPTEANIKGLHRAVSALSDHYNKELAELRDMASSDDLGQEEQKQIGQQLAQLQSILSKARLSQNASALWKAFGSIGTAAAGGVPACMQHAVTQYDLELDQDPHLMGCSNGVLDLRTGVLRDGAPEDRVSMSVEYAMEIRPPSDKFLEEVVGRIFPIEEEREAVRKFMAYSLFGEAPCKAMFIFTDVCGGNNGKSFILSLLVAAMGEYATLGDVRMILDTAKSMNASSHDEAGAALKKKRLNLMDESIDGKLKVKANTAGVQQKKAHRRCGAPLTKADYFADTAKNILACNEGDLPHVDQKDLAEALRLLFAHMRAKFVDNVEAYTEEHPDQQYVYQKDETLGQHDFRVDMINWLLPAYRELYQRTDSGVVTLDLDKDVPESFKSFKADRLSAQAAPADIKEEMQAFFEEHWQVLDEPGKTQKKYIEDKEFVQASKFLDEFRYTAAGHAALSAARNHKEANQQFNACFAALCPERFKPQVEGGLRKLIVGAKRKLADTGFENMGIDGHI